MRLIYPISTNVQRPVSKRTLFEIPLLANAQASHQFIRRCPKNQVVAIINVVVGLPQASSLSRYINLTFASQPSAQCRGWLALIR
jgi:hypothetical protein